MSRTNVRLAAFRWTVAAMAVLVLWLLARQVDLPPVGRSMPLWGLGFLAVLAMVAEQWVLQMPSYGVVTMADAVAFASVILYGPLASLLVVCAAGFSRFLRESRRRSVEPSYALYSVAQGAVTFGLGSWFYAEYAVQGSFFGSPLAGVRNTAAFAGTVTVCFLLQSVLAALHKWLDQGAGVWSSRVNWRRLRIYLQVVGPLGLLLAVAFEIQPVAVVLLLGPLVVTYVSLKRYTDTLREARMVIENLAEAVEKRDPHTGGHSVRVAAYAEEIARELRLPETDVSRIAAAGRLHDLGKISVADDVLMKLEALSEEEYESIKRHVEVGAQVAGQLSLSREEALYIRHHHEWFDGNGYPDRLAGEDIPLGARVLAVAEAFDTMTTPRSYRGALPREEALAKLEAGRGLQFDPRVLDAFRVIVRRKWAEADTAARGLEAPPLRTGG